jgi:hypothetical protein
MHGRWYWKVELGGPWEEMDGEDERYETMRMRDS